MTESEIIRIAGLVRARNIQEAFAAPDRETLRKKVFDYYGLLRDHYPEHVVWAEEGLEIDFEYSTTPLGNISLAYDTVAGHLTLNQELYPQEYQHSLYELIDERDPSTPIDLWLPLQLRDIEAYVPFLDIQTISYLSFR